MVRGDSFVSLFPINILTVFTVRLKIINATFLFVKSIYRLQSFTFTTNFTVVFNKMLTKMITYMKSLAGKFKILNTIIKFIFINMMNNFFWKRLKFSTKKLFHYYSMLSNLFIVYCNKFVSMKDLTTALWSRFSNIRISLQFPTIVMFRAISFGMNFFITIFNSTYFHNVNNNVRNQLCQEQLKGDNIGY